MYFLNLESFGNLVLLYICLTIIPVTGFFSGCMQQELSFTHYLPCDRHHAKCFIGIYKTNYY